MKRFLHVFGALLLICAASAFAQAPAATPPAPPQFVLGAGSGFKPYQTPLRSGASAFVEGGMLAVNSAGLYAFLRVDMLSTYAQMVAEGCKALKTTDSMLLLACGGPGFGADSNNVGIALAASGKLIFAPQLLRKQNAWLGVEMGVDKTTVPAPAAAGVNVSPVQPSFRIGIFRVF